MQRILRFTLLGLVGCGAPKGAEDDSDWWQPGTPYDVLETVEFTDVPYDFTGETPIADVPVVAPFAVEWADEGFALPMCPDWSTSQDLPVEITGIVTILPRYYFKSDGCNGDAEKFYGSYFIQDATGGYFVLGDSKTSHFQAGARVTLSIRGLANRFDLPMVVGHDTLEVSAEPEPIYYEVANGPFALEDIAQVRRITGVVSSETDTFGAFTITGDDGTIWVIGLDIELNRRGIRYEPGTRITATGPVQYSFSTFEIVVMQKGQIQVLAESSGE